MITDIGSIPRVMNTRDSRIWKKSGSLHYIVNIHGTRSSLLGTPCRIDRPLDIILPNILKLRVITVGEVVVDIFVWIDAPAGG